MTTKWKNKLTRLCFFMFLVFYSGLQAQDSGNLMPNSSAEESVSQDKMNHDARASGGVTEYTPMVPKGWGVFNTGQTKIKWGRVENEAHSGKASCCMTVNDFDISKKLFLYILFCECNGIAGGSATEVQINTTYVFSFWAKGNIDKMSSKIISWKSSDGNPANRESLGSSLKEFKPDDKQWKLFSGEFKTKAETKRVAVTITFEEVKPGQSIYIDDVDIRIKPEAKKIGMGGNIKVALYDLGPLKASENKYVILGQQANENIYNLLKKQNDISVEKINTLAAETLKHYNVLILSTIHRLSDKDAGSADLGIQSVDYVRSLLNFVDSGGCVILGHDCVGFRHIWGNFQVFPMICTGQGLEESKKLVLSDKAHPLAAGLPETFEHSYTDHITIRPGEKTKIIFKDVNGAPAVVAGELSRGTVIGLGYSMGLYCKDKNHYTGELPEAEARLLLNAVRWAGVKEKYEVPQVNTDTSLLKQITTYNEQKKNESLSKYTNLPQPKFTEADMWLYPFWRIMLGNKKDTPVLDILENEQYLAQSVKNVKTMGFTGILTYAQSYTMYYPSKLYPQDIDPKMPKRFEILYNEAKKNGLKIKVIFCAWRRSADTWAKGVKNISKSDMDRLAKGEKEKDIFKDEYRRGGWVCPDHPDNQKMFINIIRETLEMYPDISEVHFDYVRYKDGYDTSCYCDYSLKQKAEFSKTHPGLSESEIAAEFSKQTLMNFFTECHNQVKKISPQIKTTTYTITPTAPKWVFGYPFDYHAKYVSRYLNADWPIENTENYTTQYVGWLKELNPKGVFQPMISSYDYKTGERLYLEFQILSHTFDKLSVKNKLVQFYDYAYLLKDTDGSLHDDMARGISKALGGTWK